MKYFEFAEFYYYKYNCKLYLGIIDFGFIHTKNKIIFSIIVSMAKLYSIFYKCY